MRALLTIASLLLACSAAQAQYTIEYEGRTIRIDPDRGTVSIPGVYDNTGKKAKRARTNQDGSQKQAPAPQKSTTVDRQPSSDGPAKPSVQDAQTPAPTAQPSIPANTTPPATATNAPANANAAAAPPAPIQQGAAPVTPPRLPPWRRAPPTAPATDGDRVPKLQLRRRQRRLRQLPSPAQRAAGSRDRCGNGRPGSACPRSQFSDRHLAHRGKGRQGPHRALRRQSLRLFARCKIEREQRTGADRHEARQGPEDGAGGFTIPTPAAITIRRSR